MGDAGVTIVADQSACCGELGGGAFNVAFQSIARGKERAKDSRRRGGAARLFAPGDRLVSARLQQMGAPDDAASRSRSFQHLVDITGDATPNVERIGAVGY